MSPVQAKAVTDSFLVFATQALPILHIQTRHEYEEALAFVEYLFELAEDSETDPINDLITLVSRSIEAYEDKQEELVKFEQEATDRALFLEIEPLIISELAGIPVRLRQPLKLTSFPDADSGQYLCVEAPELGLSAFAVNRALLYNEIQMQLKMLWQEYACAADEELDAEARQLKRNLLAVMEVQDAQA